MSDVQRADAKGIQRAIICYMMAGVLLLQAIVIRPDQIGSLGRSSMWVATILMAGLCLTPFAGWAVPRGVRRLLNDEGTRQHRMIAMTAAFWATLLSASVITLLNAGANLPVMQIVRLIVTASLGSALVTFATLELRAGR